MVLNEYALWLQQSNMKLIAGAGLNVHLLPALPWSIMFWLTDAPAVQTGVCTMSLNDKYKLAVCILYRMPACDVVESH